MIFARKSVFLNDIFSLKVAARPPQYPPLNSDNLWRSLVLSQCVPRRQSVFNLQLTICKFYKNFQDLETYHQCFFHPSRLCVSFRHKLANLPPPACVTDKHGRDSR